MAKLRQIWSHCLSYKMERAIYLKTCNFIAPICHHILQLSFLWKCLTGQWPLFNLFGLHIIHRFEQKNPPDRGGSPGLVVMGDDSCLRGCGFESRHCILDWHDIFCINLLYLDCLFQRPKMNKKRPGLALLIKQHWSSRRWTDDATMTHRRRRWRWSRQLDRNGD